MCACFVWKTIFLIEFFFLAPTKTSAPIYIYIYVYSTISDTYCEYLSIWFWVCTVRWPFDSSIRILMSILLNGHAHTTATTPMIRKIYLNHENDDVVLAPFGAPTHETSKNVCAIVFGWTLCVVYWQWRQWQFSCHCWCTNKTKQNTIYTQRERESIEITPVLSLLIAMVIAYGFTEKSQRKWHSWMLFNSVI